MFEQLNKLIQFHLSLPFPAHSANGELENWIFELTEFDGHYIGIAMSIVNSQKAMRIDMSDLKKMKQQLNKIQIKSDQDKIIYESCKSYLHSIEKIILEINQEILPGTSETPL